MSETDDMKVTAIAPWWAENGITLYRGDNRLILPKLGAASVNCCVTSPPYWGLRDYGTATWDGGDAACDHFMPRLGGNGPSSPINGLGSDRDESVGLIQYRGECKKCGARRTDSQIGLEQTPEAYVAEMVAVFREVRRVLKDDGTLWLNLGDSYCSDDKWGGASGGKNYTSAAGGFPRTRRGTDCDPKRKDAAPGQPMGRAASGCKPKDLVGIPWMVAFALRADGWYLRQDIIWHKPNPMPESVTDRCTKAHEYLFLLSKSERYYFNADAIKEDAVYSTAEQKERADESQKSFPTEKRNGIRFSVKRGDFNGKTNAMPGREAFRAVTESRNKRSVWTVPTHPYSAAHFATFPPDLIKPCILAGVPDKGVCLDPFFGAGTTGLVCQQQHVRCIGVELNEKYCEIAKRRLAQGSMFT